MGDEPVPNILNPIARVRARSRAGPSPSEPATPLKLHAVESSSPQSEDFPARAVGVTYT